MLKAVIYARFSSDNQREESITAQLRACNAYCKQKGYTVVKEYTDEAYTARSDDRPDFQNMISDAKVGAFDILICHKIDRFSRDRYDYAYYQRQLKKNRVTVEFVEQKLDGSPESIILESVLVGMAEYYSRNLAKEVIKGLRENAYKCQHTGGQPPLGYDVAPNKKYAINEAEAPIIRMIFAMYVQGSTYGDIISALNDKGYRTKRGSLFGKNSLHDILRNKKYIGIYTFGKTTGGKSNPRNSHKTDANIIEIEDGLPAIIDESTWTLAQERLLGRVRQSGGQHAKEVYLLAGLMKCGECGSSLVGNRYMGTHRSLGKSMYRYYKCSKSLNTNVNCFTKKLKKEWIESLVISYVKEKIFKPSCIKAIVSSINDKLKNDKKHHNAELQSVMKEKCLLQKKIDNLLLVIENGDIDDLIRERLLQNKDRLREINTRIAVIQAESENTLDERKVRAVLESWTAAEDPEELRSMLTTFVKSIIVNKDNISIELKLKIGEYEYDSDILSDDFTRHDMIKNYLTPKF